jgi:hypothetical protein
MITWGKAYWPFFLLAVSGAFLIPEIYALFTNAANTLSEYSWDELHVTGFQHVHSLAWYFSLISWILFFVVITMHIWFRRFT